MIAGAAVVALAAGAPAASASLGCSFDAGTGALSVDVGAGTAAMSLTRDGLGAIRVAGDGAPAGCGLTTPTADNTTSIDVVDSSPGGTTLSVDLGGPLPAGAPGSAIDASVESGAGNDSVSVLDGLGESVDCGPGGADSVTADDAGLDAIAAPACEQIDLAPDTSVSGGPPDGAATNVSSPFYQLGAGEPASFSYSVDGGAYAPCASLCRVATLADGPHTLDFRATDSADLTERTPAARTLSVDTFVRTAIRRAPRERSARRNASYKFRAEEIGIESEDTDRYSEEQGATFACSLDERPFVACASPRRYRHLRYGRHVFRVAATDDVGNVDTTPATDSFHVVPRGRL